MHLQHRLEALLMYTVDNEAARGQNLVAVAVTGNIFARRCPLQEMPTNSKGEYNEAPTKALTNERDLRNQTSTESAHNNS